MRRSSVPGLSEADGMVERKAPLAMSGRHGAGTQHGRRRQEPRHRRLRRPAPRTQPRPALGPEHDRRATYRPGYAVSQQGCERIDGPFGWIKTAGDLRETRHRGHLVGRFFVLTAAGYNPIRIPKRLSIG
jgi:hypothetical protein